MGKKGVGVRENDPLSAVWWPMIEPVLACLASQLATVSGQPIPRRGQTSDAARS